jgi:hypothetical protein
MSTIVNDAGELQPRARKKPSYLDLLDENEQGSIRDDLTTFFRTQRRQVPRTLRKNARGRRITTGHAGRAGQRKTSISPFERCLTAGD